MIRRVLPLVLMLATAPMAAQLPANPQFNNLFLNQTQNGKTIQRTIRLVYAPEALQVWSRMPPTANIPEPPALLMAFPYGAIASGEYAYMKEPRTALASGVSLLFAFSNGKSHWLTVNATDGRQAVMRLDKNNYKLIVAELEKRANITVQTTTEDD